MWQGLSRATPIVIVAAIALASCGRPSPTPAVASPPAAAAVDSSQSSCPITRGQQPQFIPRLPQATTPPGGEFWYGTAALWTALPNSGAWPDLPYERGSYVQKVFWWSEGYDRSSEPLPALSVDGARLDGPAKSLAASTATNAFGPDIGSAMLVLIQIPASGCWRITGHYRTASLSFVVWIPN